jgi:hypothetical protein
MLMGVNSRSGLQTRAIDALRMVIFRALTDLQIYGHPASFRVAISNGLCDLSGVKSEMRHNPIMASKSSWLMYWGS